MKDRLLKKRPREVDIDGDKFFVRSLTLAESIKVDELSAAANGDPGKTADALSYMLCHCVVDANGNPVIDENEAKEIQIDVASRLAEEVRKATRPPSLENQIKNSEPTHSVAPL